MPQTPYKSGTLLQDADHGICTVISARRTGHQYERYYEYEILTEMGTIIKVDEYSFCGSQVKVIKEIEND